MSTRLYGSLPEDLGLIDLTPNEMMFWQYCPIKMPWDGSILHIPENLKWAREIVFAANRDFTASYPERSLAGHYIYLTAKTLWVSGNHIGNRPGWHCDGFGGDDINYIWYDRAPTEFLHVRSGIGLSEDCDESMKQMASLGAGHAGLTGMTVFPDKHLLRLDPSVIHRSPVNFTPGMRTFVKVSISEDRYDLIGNSINHNLAFPPPTAPRQLDRNHPASRHA